MPRSNLETPSNNGDGALETLEAAAAEAAEAEEEEEEEESDPEMPPESFRIGIGEEFAWAELNAVLDRDDSTRGSANPKSQQQHHHHANPSKPRSDDSQRFSGIIVLPGAIPISGAYLGRSARRARRKKMAGNGGGGKGGRGDVPETDPGSPKVSCAGKVMSQRARRPNPGILRRSPGDEGDEDEEATGGRRGSFVAAALRLFCGSGGGASPSENIPAMGGVKRFASGRRGERSCGGGADGGMYCHVSLSRPLDREIVAGNAPVGSFEAMGRDRD